MRTRLSSQEIRPLLEAHNVRDIWLNDAVTGFVNDRGTFAPFIELSHLSVACATTEYMLAMKCLAMQTGEGYHDEQDVRYLLRNLGIRRYEDAELILGKYCALSEYRKVALDAVREIVEVE